MDEKLHTHTKNNFKWLRDRDPCISAFPRQIWSRFPGIASGYSHSQKCPDSDNKLQDHSGRFKTAKKRMLTTGLLSPPTPPHWNVGVCLPIKKYYRFLPSWCPWDGGWQIKGKEATLEELEWKGPTSSFEDETQESGPIDWDPHPSWPTRSL